MRLFTAIDISREVAGTLRALLARLRPAADLHWSPVENLHVTTKFIGEWPEDRLEEMKATLASVPAGGAIPITVRGLGWFPHPRSPRVFWAGVDGGESLSRLAAATESAVASLGVAKESRSFSPHLTLARVRERTSLEALHKAIAALGSEEFGSFRAMAFFLYLSASGRYSKLAEFQL